MTPRRARVETRTDLTKVASSARPCGGRRQPGGEGRSRTSTESISKPSRRRPRRESPGCSDGHVPQLRRGPTTSACPAGTATNRCPPGRSTRPDLREGDLVLLDVLEYIERDGKTGGRVAATGSRRASARSTGSELYPGQPRAPSWPYRWGPQRSRDHAGHEYCRHPPAPMSRANAGLGPDPRPEAPRHSTIRRRTDLRSAYHQCRSSRVASLRTSVASMTDSLHEGARTAQRCRTCV